MSEPVRKLGYVNDADDCPFSVGVDHDLVTVWPNNTDHAPRSMTMRLDTGQLRHFASLLAEARREAETWMAGECDPDASHE